MAYVNDAGTQMQLVRQSKEEKLCSALHQQTVESPEKLLQQLHQRPWQQPQIGPVPQSVHVTQRPAEQTELPELPQLLEPRPLLLPLLLPSEPYLPYSEAKQRKNYFMLRLSTCSSMLWVLFVRYHQCLKTNVTAGYNPKRDFGSCLY